MKLGESRTVLIMMSLCIWQIVVFLILSGYLVRRVSVVSGVQDNGAETRKDNGAEGGRAAAQNLGSNGSKLAFSRGNEGAWPDAALAELGINLDDCEKLCSECESRAQIEQQWGATVARKYDQTSCCQYHMVLRRMLLDLQFFFQMQRMSYWLSFGTLLGVVRHKGHLVPWDKDADVFVDIHPRQTGKLHENRMYNTETFHKLMAWDDVMPRSPFKMRPCTMHDGSCTTAFKLHLRTTPFVNRLLVHGPKVDIMPVMLDNEGEFRVANKYWWNRASFSRETIMPLAGCRLYSARGNNFLCPKKPIEVLKNIYGEEVADVAVSLYDYWAVEKRGVDGPMRISAGSLISDLKSRVGSGLPEKVIEISKKVG